MKQSIELKHIEIFVKAVELRSFTEAAKSLEIPKSTVSRAITHLETGLKSQLFYRNTRQIELTALGQSLYANCRDGVVSLQRGIRSTLDSSQELGGVIRLTAVEDIGVFLLSPMISIFGERYPNIGVDMVLTSQTVDLIAQSIDIAVRVGKVKPQTFRGRKVGQIRFILVASARYLERFSKPLTPDDLSDSNLVSFAGFDVGKKGLSLINRDKKIHITPPVRFQSTNTSALLELVRSGMGIGLLPDFLCTEGIRHEQIIQVCKGWHTTPKDVSIITPAHKKGSAAANLFADFLFESLKEKFA